MAMLKNIQYTKSSSCFQQVNCLWIVLYCVLCCIIVERPIIPDAPLWISQRTLTWFCMDRLNL